MNPALPKSSPCTQGLDKPAFTFKGRDKSYGSIRYKSSKAEIELNIAGKEGRGEDIYRYRQY